MINLNKEDKNYQKNLDEIKKKSEENKVAQEQLKSAYAILTTYIYNAADA
jgi:NurA-like 5'-3' nuclease